MRYVLSNCRERRMDSLVRISINFWHRMSNMTTIGLTLDFSLIQCSHSSVALLNISNLYQLCWDKDLPLSQLEAKFWGAIRFQAKTRPLLQQINIQIHHDAITCYIKTVQKTTFSRLDSRCLLPEVKKCMTFFNWLWSSDWKLYVAS